MSHFSPIHHTQLQKRSVDESSKPFSVKRSRPDSKPTMREDDDDDNDGSFEVLDGDKRCKTGNSPQRLETAAIPFDVIITLGGGLTSSGEPTPWVVARLRDGNLKFDSPDVYHLLLSRVRFCGAAVAQVRGSCALCHSFYCCVRPRELHTRCHRRTVLDSKLVRAPR